MTQAKNNIYYDSKFDDLTIKVREHQGIYAEEIYNNIYIYYSEEDDSIVGAQILYLSKRADSILKKYLPTEIYNIVSDLRGNIGWYIVTYIIKWSILICQRIGCMEKFIYPILLFVASTTNKRYNLII